MKVVPFGTSASPFLLFAVMRHHFERYRAEFPDIIPMIESNFYVDDLLFAHTFESVKQLERFQERVTKLFALAGMNIRKWRTNSHEIDHQWAPDGSNQVKVLGHKWHVNDDCLSLAVDLDRLFKVNQLTKRTFSSFLSSIYDPLGLVSPYTVNLRLFLRKLWQAKVTWDQPVPEDLREEALQLMNEIHMVNSAQVSRNVIDSDQPAELLIFCDASQRAVGAVAYSKTKNGTNLIVSKAKLAREATIPELELDALFMASDLACKLTAVRSFSGVTIFSDSLPNLQRLLKHPNKLKPAVSIRIAQLKKTVSAKYRHVESKANIADIITRGSTLKSLLKNKNWWKGPSISPTTKFEQTLFTSILAFKVQQAEPESNNKCTFSFSKYSKAFNTFRRLAKFIKSASRKQRYKDLHLDQLAIILMIKTSQRKHFQAEITNLEAKKPISKQSVLRNYNCFLDHDGILRLRTRLEKAVNLTYDQIYPVVMPSHCSISRAIVMREHSRVMHAGIARTVDAVRDRYFILRVKELATNVRKHCRMCKWIRANNETASFGALPPFRMDESEPPFTNTGLDIFGPMKVRMKTPGKRYGLIFTCATTRAVHLEVMSDMTADQVFWAFRRFIARRGIPSLIYSDNGSQLVAVKKRFVVLLEELRQVKPDFEIRVVWIFQTAISPWRGGFYERLIRSVKYALITLTFKKPLEDIELETILYEIESHMNSRPLFTIDGKTITPAHFFTGKSLTRLPPIGNNEARNISRVDIIDAYLKNQRYVNAVWNEWRTQYLLQLRQYHQNVNQPKSPFRFQVDDVVILKNNQPHDSWPLGRIVKLHTSPDGIVRSVDVEFKGEVKTRSIQTIIPLECQFDREAEQE